MKKIVLHLIFALIWLPARAQVKGTVTDPDGKPLVGANVFWAGTTVGTITNAEGRFSLPLGPVLPAKLVCSFVGFAHDTIEVLGPGVAEFSLKLAAQLGAVVVEETRRASNFTLMRPIVTEEMSRAELEKAPCCNLSESFETNASVDVVMTDAVSGAKRIQMLGLDGIYTQIQNENLPMATGLLSVHGLTLIPGTWVNSIVIGKGPGSVVNGHESMTGQINLEYVKPEAEELLFLNAYGSFGGRVEGNAHLAHQFSNKVAATLFLHGSAVLRPMDMNGDGFMDLPMRQQYNAMNRWHFRGKKMEGMIGLRAVSDRHVGGQLNYNPNEAPSPLLPYGIHNLNRNIEAFSKTGFIFSRDKALGITTNWRWNNQQMLFGLRNYQGTHRTIGLNAIYQQMWDHDHHTLKLGGSYVLDDFNEAFQDSNFFRTENVPGVFAEYTYNIPAKFALVTGFRADYNTLYGPIFSPRLHIKYHLREGTVVRVGGGRGQRTPNIFTDNPSIMASARNIVVRESPRPESSWTVGGGITHNYKLLGKPGTIDVSYYYTRFVNQLIIDIDSDVRFVSIYNLKGESFGHNLQVELTFEPIKQFEVKTAYKWNDVHMQIGDALRTKPMLFAHRFLVNLSYATRFKKWQFDVTGNVHGPARIPSTQANPEAYRLPQQSPWFFTLNLQITKRFKHFDVYVGAENATNYMQHRAIVAADQPFGPYFDAMLVWGPTMGINPYAGLRYIFKKPYVNRYKCENN